MMAEMAALRVMRAIGRVGAPAIVLGREGSEPFMASIQPVRERSLQPQRDGPWGVDRRRRAAMFAPWCEASAALQVEDRLQWQGEVYRVLQVEAPRLFGRPLYLWAMVEPVGLHQDVYGEDELCTTMPGASGLVGSSAEIHAVREGGGKL